MGSGPQNCKVCLFFYFAAVVGNFLSFDGIVESEYQTGGDRQVPLEAGVYLDFLTRGGWSQCKGVADLTNLANVPS